MSGYDTPNEAIRLVSLGARFAVEQQYQEQIAALASERDRALAEAASLRERIEQLERQVQVLEEAVPMADADAEVQDRALTEIEKTLSTLPPITLGARSPEEEPENRSAERFSS